MQQIKKILVPINSLFSSQQITTDELVSISKVVVEVLVVVVIVVELVEVKI